MLLSDIKSFAENFGADLREKKGIWEFSKIIAERKVFLSKKKLTYMAKFRIDDASKIVKFTEMLIEKGSGLSSGGYDSDVGMSPGFGFKKEVYTSGSGGREGSIEEQSTLFGKDYTYNFDYKEVHKKLDDLAKQNGYQFKYQITSIGL